MSAGLGCGEVVKGVTEARSWVGGLGEAEDGGGDVGLWEVEEG